MLMKIVKKIIPFLMLFSLFFVLSCKDKDFQENSSTVLVNQENTVPVEEVKKEISPENFVETTISPSDFFNLDFQI